MKAVIDSLVLSIVITYTYILKMLPDKLARNLSRVVSRTIVSCFFVKRKKIAMRNLEIVFPDLSQKTHREIFKDSLNVIGDNIFAFTRIPEMTSEALENYISTHFDLELVKSEIQKAKAAHPGTGILFPACHYGAIERGSQILHHVILRHTATEDNEKLAVINRGFNLPKVDMWINRWRSQHGIEMFSRKGAFQQMCKNLRENKSIAVLYDQNVRKSYAAFVPLFGISTATNKSIVLAALKTGAAIVFISWAEMSKVGYTFCKWIDYRPYLDLPKDEMIVKVLTEVNRCNEQIVRDNPEQWLWVHRRFKTRPPGEENSFYEDIN